ncbi:2613_t:CDS:2 [Ambispora gerdemannii]|uniref:2613_t:CDS:1 n=1 Tax=Ambispora gerdemannii TaxID=144530 RepID=A0A9N9GUI8_9GLOM|nr:2613_t:CDS:2 [Ambispora gerdemannii]
MKISKVSDTHHALDDDRRMKVSDAHEKQIDHAMSKYKKWLDESLELNLIKNIKYEEIENEQKLSEGSFGIVTTAYWKDLREMVACKRLKLEHTDTQENEDKFWKSFVNELKINKKMYYCQYVIRFLAISQVPEAKPSNINRLQLACQVANGMHMLHKEGIHSKNILVQKGVAKLTDFGMSRIVANTNSSTSNGVFGIIPYIAPECLRYCDYPLDTSSDIYSFGVILWEIANPHGKYAFEGRQFDGAFMLSIIDGLRETPNSETESDYVKLYQECWDPKPENRPLMSSALQRIERIQSM